VNHLVMSARDADALKTASEERLEKRIRSEQDRVKHGVPAHAKVVVPPPVELRREEDKARYNRGAWRSEGLVSLGAALKALGLKG